MVIVRTLVAVRVVVLIVEVEIVDVVSEELFEVLLKGVVGDGGVVTGCVPVVVSVVFVVATIVDVKVAPLRVPALV